MNPGNPSVHILDKRDRERIRRLRLTRRMTVKQLAAKAKITTKTLYKLENPSEKSLSFRESVLELVAEALELELSQLLGLRPIETLACSLSDDFLEIADAFATIDRHLVPRVHALHLPAAQVAETYEDLLDHRLQKAGHSRKEIVEWLNSSEQRGAIRTRLPADHLTLEVGERFGSLRFSIPEGRLDVRNPRLLWDCHHRTPCERPQEFKCPIHDHPLGSLVRSRFTAAPVVIKHDGLEFLWRYAVELFPPSVDSFHMLEVLEGEGEFRQPIESCLDLGAGTGFLGICLAKRNGRVASVTLRDWLLSPALFSAVNAERNKAVCPSTRFSVELGYLAPPHSLTDRRYDLVVCNPPYLPLLGDFESLGWLSTVAGTSLLEFVIENATSLGRRVYVQFSDLALPEARAARERSGHRLRPVGKPRPTPFRVEIAWEKEGYLEALRQRGLQTRLEERHPYWHTIRTYRVE